MDASEGTERGTAGARKCGDVCGGWLLPRAEGGEEGTVDAGECGLLAYLYGQVFVAKEAPPNGTEHGSGSAGTA